MCWYNKTIQFKKASNDITCFKTGFKKENPNYFESFYRNFIYKKKERYYQKITPKVMGGCDYVVEEGYHSYSNNSDIYSDPNKLMISSDKLLEIIHYSPLDNIDSSNLVLVKCIIPKDTIYLINDDEEIVSECIVIDDIQVLDKNMMLDDCCVNIEEFYNSLVSWTLK